MNAMVSEGRRTDGLPGIHTRATRLHAGAGRPIRIGLPKGRMQGGVLALLSDAGIDVRTGSRSYRPVLSGPGFGAKLLKPQDVVKMLHAGSRDIGFAGADWVAELGADLVELLDTGLDPVEVVAAAPASLLDAGTIPAGRRLVLATEYVRMAERWVREQPFEAVLVRSYGATEVFPPEDADLIVDNTATGATLRGNGLVVAATLMHSSWPRKRRRSAAARNSRPSTFSFTGAARRSGTGDWTDSGQYLSTNLSRRSSGTTGRDPTIPFRRVVRPGSAADCRRIPFSGVRPGSASARVRSWTGWRGTRPRSPAWKGWRHTPARRR